MMRLIGLLVVMAVGGLVFSSGPAGAAEPATDVITGPQGRVEVTCIGHASLILTYGDLVIQVDPWSKLADYSRLPKADLILVTHQHRDHLDPAAIEAVTKPGTVLITSAKVAEQLGRGRVMANGDRLTVKGVAIEAIPAYNLVHHRPSGRPYHPKGEGNGYLLTLAGMKIYIAGDTENTPEMKALTGVTAAFLPMNLPYTMTPAMVADAAKAFKPGILYPYHMGNMSNVAPMTAELKKLLKNTPQVEVRVLPFGR